MFAYSWLKGMPELRRESWRIIKVGLGIFVAAGIFFELIIGVSGFGLGRFGWPLLLIVLGIFLFARNLVSAGWHKEEVIGPEKAPQEEYHVYDNS
jgi:Na+/melibiose symporter-like transporter